MKIECVWLSNFFIYSEEPVLFRTHVFSLNLQKIIFHSFFLNKSTFTQFDPYRFFKLFTFIIYNSTSSKPTVVNRACLFQEIEEEHDQDLASNSRTLLCSANSK